MNTPTTKKKGPGSIGGADDPNDDTKSNASSSSSNKAQVRRTPAQVKAADAKKAKVIESPILQFELSNSVTLFIL